MSKIIPFAALIPNPERAQQVICPPYDVIDSAGARAYAKGNSYSLLHVTKPEIDLDPSVDQYDDRVYAKGAENLARFVKEGTLRKDAPSLYVYRMVRGNHVQTGIVAGASAEEYESGAIKRHEKTREEKVVDRTRHSLAIRGHAEPVFLVHRHAPAIGKLISASAAAAPLYDLTDHDGVRHTMWRAADPDAVVATFLTFPALYIADGHHRSETAHRTRKEMQAKNPAHTGKELYNFFPAVILDEDQVKIYAYDWDGPADQRPLAKVTMADVMKLSDEGGIMPPKSTWFAPKLASGLFIFPF
jgi:uncharacterized protein (DUF1015 family)